MKKNNYLIWSYEHKAWWKANECGYTTDVLCAGEYDFNKAVQICKGANRDGEVNEVMIHARKYFNSIDL